MNQFLAEMWTRKQSIWRCFVFQLHRTSASANRSYCIFFHSYARLSCCFISSLLWTRMS